MSDFENTVSNFINKVKCYIQELLTGVTTYTLISEATPNATIIKTTSGRIFGIEGFNNSATIHYLKLYDKATTPTDSDIPLAVYLIPSGTTGTGIIRDFSHPLKFTSGIAFRIVTGIANNNNTSATVDAVTINIQYL